MTVVHGANEAGKTSWLQATFAGLCGRRRGTWRDHPGGDAPSPSASTSRGTAGRGAPAPSSSQLDDGTPDRDRADDLNEAGRRAAEKTTTRQSLRTTSSTTAAPTAPEVPGSESTCPALHDPDRTGRHPASPPEENGRQTRQRGGRGTQEGTPTRRGVRRPRRRPRSRRWRGSKEVPHSEHIGTGARARGSPSSKAMERTRRCPRPPEQGKRAAQGAGATRASARSRRQRRQGPRSSGSDHLQRVQEPAPTAKAGANALGRNRPASRRCSPAANRRSSR